MIFKKGVLSGEMVKQKEMMKQASQLGDRELLAKAEMIGKDISLAISEFRCQSRLCQATNNLQFHHLITSYCKSYMPEWRYMIQRIHWGNIVILCRNCHERFHQGTTTIRMHELEEKGSNIIITTGRIAKVREKFFIKEEKKKEVKHDDRKIDIETSSQSEANQK